MNSRLEGSHQLQGHSSPMANERKQSSPKMEITKLNHELIEECKRSHEDSILPRHLRHELEKYVWVIADVYVRICVWVYVYTRNHYQKLTELVVRFFAH